VRLGARSRELTATCTAALLHAGVLAVSLLVARAPDLAMSSTRLRADVEVDLVELPPPASASPADPPSETAAAPAPPRSASAAVARAAPVEAAAGAGTAVAEERPSGAPEAVAPPDTAPSPPRPPEDYSPTPGREVGVPGLGGTPVWAVPGAVAADVPRPAATTPELPHATDRNVAGKVIEGTLRKKDQELGLELPSAGVVAGTVAEAVRGIETTEDARATFEVALGAQGDVRAVKVVSFSTGDAGMWERAAKRAASSLGGRGLNTQGEPVTVVVKVESKQLYPAGSKEKIDAQPVCVNEVIEDVALALQEVAGGPTKPVAPRPATLDPRKRFCIPVGIAGTGDASNIGAHKTTVVHSSFKVVRTGDRKLPGDRVQPLDDRAPWLAPAEGVQKRYELPKKPKKKKPKQPT